MQLPREIEVSSPDHSMALRKPGTSYYKPGAPRGKGSRVQPSVLCGPSCQTESLAFDGLV